MLYAGKFWGACLCLAALLAGATAAAAADATNGVSGGYVGSDQWFKTMTDGARTREMMNSLSQGNEAKNKKTPVDSVEVKGKIIFPEGNPFPKQKLPDLRIKCTDSSADNVLRAPFLSKDGAFTTVLKRGQNYEVYWMYFMGGKEKFATISIEPQGPPQREISLSYTPAKSGSSADNAGTSSQQATATRSARPQTGGGIDSTGSSVPYQPPKVDRSYQAPRVGPGFVAPQVGPGYTAPQAGSRVQPPRAGVK